MLLYLCWVIHVCQKKHPPFNVRSCYEKEYFNLKVILIIIADDYVIIMVTYFTLNEYGLYGSNRWY